MVKKCGPACPEAPEQCRPPMPPIEPLVSVSSVNGMTGDVVLKDLIIGEKHYNGSDQKAIYASDIYRDNDSDTHLSKAFVYISAVATIAQAEAKMVDAECGDIYFCRENEKFYLSVGEGDFKTFNDAEGGGQPEEFLKKAVVEGTTLKLYNKDDSIVTFAIDLSPYRKTAEQAVKDAEQDASIATKQAKLTAGQNITIDENNVISATGGGLVDDVKVDGVSVVTEKVANIDLTGKQAVITDLDTIRAGAALGATAVQPAALAEYRKTADQAIKDGEQDTAIAAKQNKLVAGSNIVIDQATNTISAICEAGIPGVYIGSVVRAPENPLPQRNLIGLMKDPDADLSKLYDNGYENYIADNYSCTCFAIPQTIGPLVKITMNGQGDNMLSFFNRVDDYTAKDGTKFYIYTYKETVNPEYNRYNLFWKL